MNDYPEIEGFISSSKPLRRNWLRSFVRTSRALVAMRLIILFHLIQVVLNSVQVQTQTYCTLRSHCFSYQILPCLWVFRKKCIRFQWTPCEIFTRLLKQKCICERFYENSFYCNALKLTFLKCTFKYICNKQNQVLFLSATLVFNGKTVTCFVIVFIYLIITFLTRYIEW